MPFLVDDMFKQSRPEASSYMENLASHVSGLLILAIGRIWISGNGPGATVKCTKTAREVC